MPLPKGCTQSEEAKRKIGQAQIGHTSFQKGKTYEQLYGVERAKELKLKHSNRMTGKKLSDEHKMKLKFRKGKNWEETYGIEKATLMKKQQSELCRRVKPRQFVKTPSIGQVELFKKVKLLNRNVVLEFPVEVNVNKTFFLDIAIPDQMTDIEYDGSYWHQVNEENVCTKDVERDTILQSLGWTVIRIKDADSEEVVQQKLNGIL